MKRRLKHAQQQSTRHLSPVQSESKQKKKKHNKHKKTTNQTHTRTPHERSRHLVVLLLSYRLACFLLLFVLSSSSSSSSSSHPGTLFACSDSTPIHRLHSTKMSNITESTTTSIDASSVLDGTAFPSGQLTQSSVGRIDTTGSGSAPLLAAHATDTDTTFGPQHSHTTHTRVYKPFCV